MNVSRIFIERPVATGLFMLAIVLTGLLGLRFLPVAALPQVDYPTIQVQTLYPGASPDVMSRTVTAPLERQLGQMSGLDSMTSVSAAGVSRITLQFSLKQSMNVAEQQVQAALSAASTMLPSDLPSNPIYAKVNPADAPVLTLAITSGTLPLTEVQNMVNTRLALKISQINGVGLVTLSGGNKPAMRISADTQKLAFLGLGLDDITSAISAGNANGAKGSFDGDKLSYTIDSNDQLLTALDYQNLIISYKNGTAIRLKDVADVSSAAENNRLGAWAAIKSNQANAGNMEKSDGDFSNLTPAILLNVQRQPDANVIETVNAIKATLSELTSQLPDSVEVSVLTDRTNGIRASVSHVQMELLLAIFMVVLVIFLFLHSLRATVIASIAVPISLIGAVAIMYLLDYSLNNLTLMALTIATGFVVDDAIVMVENISRHREMGKSAMRAALDGAGEIGFTIISLTISLVAVLIPLLFMQEVIGRLFREFAVTLAITILISAVISLTLVPMLGARWLEPLVHDADSPQKGINKVGAIFQRGIDKVIKAYDKSLMLIFANQGLTLFVMLATIFITAFMYWAMPKSLFPTQSTGQLVGTFVAASDVSFARMSALQERAAKIVLADDAVISVSSVVGVDAANNTMLGRGKLVINLKDAGVFDAGQTEVINRLKTAVQSEIAGVELFLRPTQDLTIDTESGATEFSFDIEGADTELVNQWAKKLSARLNKYPELENVSTNAGSMGLAAMVEIDYDAAARLGISTQAVDTALYNAFGQRIISTIFTETNQYRVILQAENSENTDLNSLADMPIKISNGQATKLKNFAKIYERQSPQQILKVGQYPAATVGFDLAPNISLGNAVSIINKAIYDDNEEGGALPASLTMKFKGAAGAFEGSLNNQIWLIIAALICVYIVLGVLYESYIHPLTILSTLPSAGIGALFTLYLTNHPLDVIGIIALVLLIGIVKKNAIMMIDFALEAERVQKMSAFESIHQAALLRFRPILMTTLAALAAAIPLMLSFGQGAELRRPLGLAIFGGLVFSQLLTLYTTPVVYLWFDKIGKKWGIK